MSTTVFAKAGILKYRWLVYELVLRDLRLRYRGSVLGFGWTLLNPIIFMAIYALVFSVYLRVQIPHYALYLLAGLVPWGWLSGALIAGTSSIVDGRVYVGKTLFPTIVLIVVPVISNAINFLLSLPVLLLFALLMHVPWGLPTLLLPLLIVIQLLIITGLVMLLATANVFYRDIAQLTTYILTALMYVTPIFYLRRQVPAAFQPLVIWNPLAPLMAAYHDIFYANRFPNASDLTYPLIFGIVLVLLAYGTFSRLQEAFSEYL